jgi:hypothetical protein
MSRVWLAADADAAYPNDQEIGDAQGIGDDLYEKAWDTTVLQNGSYILSAYGNDNAGTTQNSGSLTRTVTVANPAP